MRFLRTLSIVLAVSVAAFGQDLPRAFSGWIRTGEVKSVAAEPSLAPVLQEFRLSSTQQALYTQNGNSLSLKVYSFPDLTGAYGAFTFLREPNMRPQNVGDEAASGDNRVVFSEGNIAVDARFDHVSAMTLGQLRDLSKQLPRVANAGNPPSLPRYLPNNNLSHVSLRYVVGPAGAKAAGIPFDPSEIAWDKSPELVTAMYSMANGSARLTAISYPTPQIAAQQMKRLQVAVGGDNVRRTHSIVVIATGAQDPSDTTALLNFVNYDADLTWNEPTKLNPKENVLGLLANVIILSALLVGFMFVIGLSFGGFRALYFKFNPQAAAAHEESQQMIRLNL